MQRILRPCIVARPSIAAARASEAKYKRTYHVIIFRNISVDELQSRRQGVAEHPTFIDFVQLYDVADHGDPASWGFRGLEFVDDLPAQLIADVPFAVTGFPGDDGGRKGGQLVILPIDAEHLL